MARNLTFLLAFCTFSMSVAAQTESLSQFEKDSLALDEIRWKAWDYVSSNHDSTLFYLEKMKIEAERIGMQEYVCKYHDYLGFYYRHQEDLEKSIQHSLRAKEIALGLEDRTYLIGCLFNLAVNIEANNISTRSLQIYLECVPEFRKLKNLRGLEVTFNNIANSYAHLEQFDKTEMYLDSLVHIQALRGDTLIHSGALRSLCLEAKGDLLGAKREAREALLYNQKIADERQVFDAAIYLTEICLQLGHLAEAKEWAEVARKQQDLYNTAEITTQYDFVRAEILFYEKDFKAAYQGYLANKQMIDSVDVAQNYVSIQRGVNELEQSVKKDILLGKEEIMEQMQLKSSYQTRIFVYILVGIAVLLAAVGILHLLSVRKNRKLQNLTNQELKQDRLLRDSIVYGNKLQRALFGKKESGEVSDSKLSQWQNQNNVTGQIRSWSEPVNNGILLCFFEPTEDVISSAFKSILIYNAFNEVVETMRRENTGIGSLASVSEAINNGVMTRIKKQDYLESEVFLAFYSLEQQSLALFDGEAQKDLDLETHQEKNQSFGPLILTLENNRIAFFSKDLEQLMKQEEIELFGWNDQSNWEEQLGQKAGQHEAGKSPSDLFLVTIENQS